VKDTAACGTLVPGAVARAVARGRGARQQRAGRTANPKSKPLRPRARTCLRGGSSIASQMELLPSACARCALPGSSAASSVSPAPSAPAPAPAADAGARLRYARRLVYARRALPGSARRSTAVRRAAGASHVTHLAHCAAAGRPQLCAHKSDTNLTTDCNGESSAKQCSCKKPPLHFRPGRGMSRARPPPRGPSFP